MATEVIVLDEFAAWYRSLSEGEQASVERVVSMLEELGAQLGHPYSTAIRQSSLAMRELRVQHAGEPYRVLYVFDPARQAVLLLGGNKVGQGNRWYGPAIRRAERLYAEYIETLRGS